MPKKAAPKKTTTKKTSPSKEELEQRRAEERTLRLDQYRENAHLAKEAFTPVGLTQLTVEMVRFVEDLLMDGAEASILPDLVARAFAWFNANGVNGGPQGADTATLVHLTQDYIEIMVSDDNAEANLREAMDIARGIYGSAVGVVNIQNALDVYDSVFASEIDDNDVDVDN